MDPALLALLGGALLVGLVSATTAMLPVEVYVLGAAATQPTGTALAVAVAAGAGQTVGKVALLLGARGAASPWGLGRFVRQGSAHVGARAVGGVVAATRTGVRAAVGRAACELTTASARWLRSRWAPLLVLVSAVVGVPPLMLLSVAAGVARVPVRRFAPACFVGRTARFAVVVLVTGAVAT